MSENKVNKEKFSLHGKIHIATITIASTALVVGAVALRKSNKNAAVSAETLLVIETMIALSDKTLDIMARQFDILGP